MPIKSDIHAILFCPVLHMPKQLRTKTEGNMSVSLMSEYIRKRIDHIKPAIKLIATLIL